MTNLEIDRNFMYHSPKPESQSKFVRIRVEGKGFAECIFEECPDSAEKTLAIRKVEEAVMWANASIVRNQ